MTNEQILAELKEKFPEAIVEVPELIDFTVAIKPEAVTEVARFLHDECGLDYLALLTAVDQPERFEVVYHLWSIKDRTTEPFVLKAYIEDKENPTVPSVTPLWRGANYQEREAYDLMGIRFEGHPNLKRLVLWEGFPGHPLRKDFENRTYTFEELKPTRPTGPEW
ncbi:MAG: NADH-quinone oxidoreductase subunit C [Anaerolineae bacterium]